MDLSAALEFLAAQFNDAIAPALIHTDRDRKIYAIRDRLETITEHVPTRHQVRTLANLIAAAAHYGDDGSTLWHDRDTDRGHAWLLISPHGSTNEPDLVSCPLEHTAAHAFIVDNCLAPNVKTWTQRELIRRLSGDAHGIFPDSFLQQLRQIEVANQGRKASSIEHGRDRGTAEFARELANAQEFPEIVQAGFRVYDETPEAAGVTCRVQLDLENLTIGIVALPDEYELAIKRAHEQVAAHLAAAGDAFPIFYGRPTL